MKGTLLRLTRRDPHVRFSGLELLISLCAIRVSFSCLSMVLPSVLDNHHAFRASYSPLTVPQRFQGFYCLYLPLDPVFYIIQVFFFHAWHRSKCSNVYRFGFEIHTFPKHFVPATTKPVLRLEALRSSAGGRCASFPRDTMMTKVFCGKKLEASEPIK